MKMVKVDSTKSLYNNMADISFEAFCADFFEEAGMFIETRAICPFNKSAMEQLVDKFREDQQPDLFSATPKRGQDGGKDFTGYRKLEDGTIRTIAGQCKRWSLPISSSDLHKIIFQVKGSYDEIIVCALRGFTEDAVEYIYTFKKPIISLVPYGYMREVMGMPDDYHLPFEYNRHLTIAKGSEK